MDKYSKDKDFKLNPSKHDIIKEHIAKLERGELRAEKSNYLYFYEFILKDILGYNKSNILFEDHVKKGGKASEFVLCTDNKKEILIVELKDQRVNLDKQQKNHKNQTPVEQGREYLPKRDANWLILSNYDEFRLYHQNRNEDEYICFKFKDLLDPQKFKYFMVTFSKKSHMETNYAEDLRKESLLIEEDIEDNFYSLYHQTRLMLIKELKDKEINGFETKDAVKYAQTILNRYMFIHFAEELHNLLPEPDLSTQTIYLPIKEKNIGRRTIWNRLNELFGFINDGNPFKGINKYNGGIFKKDLGNIIEIRDIVDDPDYFKEEKEQKWKLPKHSQRIKNLMGEHGDKINPIYWNLLTISSINFESDLDVNILGHIFENSIGDLEDLKEGATGIRNQNGIFYTRPEITEYICKNTIIPYLSKSGKCTEVRDLISEYDGREIKVLDKKLKKLRIIDPACGSGAFLNKAVDLLLDIHNELHKQMYKDDTTLDKHLDNVKQRRIILKDNIFGVDLNEESVEITKLSMFIKVAHKDSELPDLDKNIKCGNSIIDNPNNSNNPFYWNSEKNFKNVFDEGGFDIVIGNPPYIATKIIKSIEREYFWDEYKEYLFSEMDTYELFTIKSVNFLLKDNGLLGFIIPNSFYTASSFIYMRKLLLNQTIKEILDFPYRFFPFRDTNKETTIIILEKKVPENNSIQITSIDKKTFFEDEEININNHFTRQIPQSNFNLEKDKFKLFITATPTALKIHISPSNYKKYISAHKGWMSVPKKTKINGVLFEKEIFNANELENNPELNKICEPCVEGEDIGRYLKSINDKFVNTSKMAKRTRSWHKTEKLIMQRITGQGSRRLIAYFDEDEVIAMPNTNLIDLRDGSDVSLFSLLGIINSKLMDYYYKKMFGESNTNIPTEVIEGFPLPNLNKKTKQVFSDIEQRVRELIIEKKDFQYKMSTNVRLLQSNFKIEKIPNKLVSFFLYSHEEIIVQLKKQNLSLNSQKTILKFFDSEKTHLKTKFDLINTLNDAIDDLVYKLYDLEEDEINIIKNSY
jgi:type I restriction-modification system DNA methylase subunit